MFQGKSINIFKLPIKVLDYQKLLNSQLVTLIPWRTKEITVVLTTVIAIHFGQM